MAEDQSADTAYAINTIKEEKSCSRSDLCMLSTGYTVSWLLDLVALPII